MMKKRLATLLKIGVTLVGLALVLRQIDPTQVGQTLRGANLLWLLVSLLLITAGMVLRAFRWSLLLHGLGLHLPLSRLILLYFVGSFFNTFLPSGFGGDVVRVLEATRDLDLDVATGTVFLDRFSGLAMLFVVALFMLPFRAALLPPWLRWFIIGGALGSLLLLALLLQHDLLCRLGGWLPGPLSPTGDGLLAKVLQAVRACGVTAVTHALLISILFNLILAGWWAAAGQALHLPIPFSYHLFAVPILSVTLLTPSIGGLGVRELAAPLIFAGAGIAETAAVTLSLLVFLLERLSSLPGAPLYLRDAMRQPTNPSSPTG